MRCYKCNSVLSEADFCTSCSADVKTYKKIVRLSNTYYNMGLDKAKIRDLTGAIEVLRKSVRMNKKNVAARNLLGLVYFEMGEYVSALSEWVISKNLQPEKNLADNYIKAIQDNPGKLDSLGATIKKYNKALSYATQGSYDLAIIQLKRVVASNPKFIRGEQLLALLYIKNKAYEKAKKVIAKSLLVDVNNTLSVRYLKEIEEIKKIEEKDSQEKTEEETKNTYLSGDDVIIPQSSYKETNNGAITVINVIIGLIIGAALVFFLITPAKEAQVKAEYKDSILKYQEDISKLNISMTELKNQVNDLTIENETYKEQLDTNKEEATRVVYYQKIIEAYEAFSRKDMVACADLLASVDITKIESEKSIHVYEALKEGSYKTASNHYYSLGVKSFDNKNWEDVITQLTKCVEYDPEKVYAWYALGVSHKSVNNNVNNEISKRCLNKVIELAPYTTYEKWAKKALEN